MKINFNLINKCNKSMIKKKKFQVFIKMSLKKYNNYIHKKKNKNRN